MIPRYSRPEMSAVWTEENKFGAYLKVEIEAAAAWSKLGVIPAEDVQKLRDKATFDVQRIYEIEKETRHDIVAFLDISTVSEGIMTRGVRLDDLPDLLLAVILGCVGLWLVRPAKRGEILAVWRAKWQPLPDTEVA